MKKDKLSFYCFTLVAVAVAVAVAVEVAGTKLVVVSTTS